MSMTLKYMIMIIKQASLGMIRIGHSPVLLKTIVRMAITIRNTMIMGEISHKTKRPRTMRCGNINNGCCSKYYLGGRGGGLLYAYYDGVRALFHIWMEACDIGKGNYFIGSIASGCLLRFSLTVWNSSTFFFCHNLLDLRREVMQLFICTTLALAFRQVEIRIGLDIQIWMLIQNFEYSMNVYLPLLRIL